jgi:glutamate 5-kinase
MDLRIGNLSLPLCVIKVGTSSLVDPLTLEVKIGSISRLVESLSKLRKFGMNIVLVTSGAVGLGCSSLKLTERPTSLAGKQACASVGQLKLMSIYQDFFSLLKIQVGQVLLTYDAFGDRSQYLNARNTFMELLKLGVVPIVNENDTVATQEIKVGDNDTLSALVASMLSAQFLFLLTDVDSLFDCNPSKFTSALPIRVVRPNEIQNLRKQMQQGVSPLCPTLSVEEALLKSNNTNSSLLSGNADTAGSAFGTGGMITKLKAALLATAAGTTVIIMNSSHIESISKVFENSFSSLDSATATSSLPASVFADKSIGTTFYSHSRPVVATRKRWILSLQPEGKLILDSGAVEAVVQGRKNIWSVGVIAIEGIFEPQDAVSISNHEGLEVARALVNFSSDECIRLKGKRSNVTVEGGDPLCDRDNVVVLKDRDQDHAT